MMIKKSIALFIMCLLLIINFVSLANVNAEINENLEEKNTNIEENSIDFITPSPPPDTFQYYRVQFSELLTSNMTTILNNQNISVEYYLQNSTYLLSIPNGQEEIFACILNAVSIEKYECQNLIKNNDISSDNIKIRIDIFEKTNINEVKSKLIAIGCHIIKIDSIGNYFIVETPAIQISEIQKINGILAIDEETEPVSYMNNVLSDSYIRIASLHSQGFEGDWGDPSGYDMILGSVIDNGYYNHPDFIDRIFSYDPGHPVESHGTSTIGILISDDSGNGKGILPKGMIWFDDWNVGNAQAINNIDAFDGVFQSNSWAYSDSLTGLYNGRSNEIDAAIIGHPRILSCWSAGNTGTGDPGPASSDEIPHGIIGVDAPISDLSASKNAVCVGGVFHKGTANKNDDVWDNTSANWRPSRGFSADGRVKPDLCGPVDGIYTTTVGGYRNDFGGTSAAAPIVAGCGGLVYEMYARNHFGNNLGNDWPISSTVKAMLIADAYQYDFSSQAARIEQGWGTPDVNKIYDRGASSHFIIDGNYQLIGGDVWTRQIEVKSPPPPDLKISLVWIDPPASPVYGGRALVNNLDLKITAPDGTIYWGNNGLLYNKYSTSGDEAINDWTLSGDSRDDKNNVENVFILSPSPGIWTIEVIGCNDGGFGIAQGPQSFSLVASGASNYPIAQVEINPGSNGFTSSNTVNLQITATQDYELSEMRFRNAGGSWSAWEPHSLTKSNWQLSPGEGLKNVDCQVKDVVGNLGNIASDSIFFDQTAPNTPTLTPNPSPGTNWVNKYDIVISGVADSPLGGQIDYYEYDIWTSTGTNVVAWTQTNENPLVINAEDIPDSYGDFTVNVRAVDKAGNVGSSSFTDLTNLDTSLPYAPLNLDDGVEGWQTTGVDFNWNEPSDRSGSNTITGYWWKIDWGVETYTTETFMNIIQSGSHTFYVRAEDGAGNRGEYASHLFKIDLNPPTAPIITLDQSAGNVLPSFSWIPSTDPGESGFTGYYSIWIDSGEKVDIPYYASTSWAPSWFVWPGSHTFYVEASDNVGRTVVQSKSFFINYAWITLTITSSDTGEPLDGAYSSLQFSGIVPTGPIYYDDNYPLSSYLSFTEQTGTSSWRVAVGIGASYSVGGYSPVISPTEGYNYYGVQTVTVTNAGATYNVVMSLPSEVPVYNPPPPSTCPFVSTWDGGTYISDNNILKNSLAQLDMGQDITDNYLINNPVRINNGNYTFRLTEFDNERTRLDQISLISVDHPAYVGIGISTDGAILTYSDPKPPISCLNQTNVSFLSEITNSGDSSFTGIDGDSLSFEFNRDPNSASAKLLIISDKKPEPPITPIGTVVADSLGPIKIEVYTESWTKVYDLWPRKKWGLDIIDLSGYLDLMDTSLMVKFTWMAEHSIDYIAFDQTPEHNITIHNHTLLFANHSSDGSITSLLQNNDEQYGWLETNDSIDLAFSFEQYDYNISRVSRNFILQTNGLYWTKSSINVWEEVNINVKMGGRKGNTLKIELIESDRYKSELINNAYLERTTGTLNEIEISLWNLADKSYILKLEWDGDIGTNPAIINIQSTLGNESFYVVFNPAYGGNHQIRYFDISKRLENITGISYMNYSDTVVYLKDAGPTTFVIPELYRLNISYHIESIIWDFGDGNYSYELSATVNHEYFNTGLYRVWITVTLANGEIVKSWKNILII